MTIHLGVDDMSRHDTGETEIDHSPEWGHVIHCDIVVRAFIHRYFKMRV